MIEIGKYISSDINVLLLFGITFTLFYLFIGMVSLIEIYRYQKNLTGLDLNQLLKSSITPSISIIAPAYNEAKVIVDCVRSLLSLRYGRFEVIIINDGSTDDTLHNVIEAYELEKIETWYTSYIPTQKIKGIYKSKNASLSRLTVIDKVNGGKSDASNAAINFSKSDYILCCDVDCIFDPDTLLKMIKPVLDETNKKVIAVGGIVRIVNGCKIERGNLEEIRLPSNFWARFQILEYIRSFLLGRIAWSKLNGLILVSGAIGLFDRKLVIQAGGYSKEILGEDMELIVKMRQMLYNVPHKVSYIPETLCWTEVPETLKQLKIQRKRWTKGMIQVLLQYRNVFFNPKFKTMGMVSFPFWMVFEWLAPLLEVGGLVFLGFLYFNGNLDFMMYIGLLLIFFSFYFIYSVLGILLEVLTFKQYVGLKVMTKLMIIAVLEPIIYHPIMVWYALLGNYEFLIGKDSSWGQMKRRGFK